MKFLILSSKNGSNWFSTGIVLDQASDEEALENCDIKNSQLFPYLTAVPIEEMDLLRLNESLPSWEES